MKSDEEVTTADSERTMNIYKSKMIQSGRDLDKALIKYWLPAQVLLLNLDSAPSPLTVHVLS